MLPSYIKSASEGVHQLHRTSPEAYSYLDYLEHFAQPTVHLLQYITSRAASDIGDIGGAVGGGAVGGVPPSPPTSVHPSPASPPNLLDLLTTSGSTTSSICSQSSTASLMQTTSHRHQWTSRTSTLGFRSRASSQASTSRRSLRSTSEPVLHIRTIASWPTSSSTAMSTLPRSARQDTADQYRSIAQMWLPQPLPAHPSTSAGNRRDQLQDHIDSTSWEKRQD